MVPTLGFPFRLGSFSEFSEIRLLKSAGYLTGLCLSIPGFLGSSVGRVQHLKQSRSDGEEGRRDLESRLSVSWPNCLLSLELIV